MGFKRVGALAKYVSSDVAPHQARTVAYRHWAYPDEDVSKMDSSIMMAIKLRAGQVVQRVMPLAGGIFPNRFRFMHTIPDRGVLCDALLRVRPGMADQSAPFAMSLDQPADEFADLEGVEGEPCDESPQPEDRAAADADAGGPPSDGAPSRRAQACRPWVCYGDPLSASGTSPKRRIDLGPPNARCALVNNPP